MPSLIFFNNFFFHFVPILRGYRQSLRTVYLYNYYCCWRFLFFIFIETLFGKILHRYTCTYLLHSTQYSIDSGGWKWHLAWWWIKVWTFLLPDLYLKANTQISDLKKTFKCDIINIYQNLIGKRKYLFITLSRIFLEDQYGIFKYVKKYINIKKKNL